MAASYLQGPTGVVASIRTLAVDADRSVAVADWMTLANSPLYPADSISLQQELLKNFWSMLQLTASRLIFSLNLEIRRRAFEDCWARFAMSLLCVDVLLLFLSVLLWPLPWLRCVGMNIEDMVVVQCMIESMMGW